MLTLKYPILILLFSQLVNPPVVHHPLHIWQMYWNVVGVCDRSYVSGVGSGG
jgi:hypothetical protein